MHMLVHIVQKSAQNDLMKGELEEALYVALKSVSKILRSEAQKLQKNVEEKMDLTLQLMVHLTEKTMVHLWNSNSAL